MRNYGEDAQLPFGSAQPQANPWYQFVSQRGDLRMGKYLVEFMKSTGDPRLPLYAAKDDTGGYSGSGAGVPVLGASRMGPLYASIDSRLPLVTFAEQKFIEAEAALRAGDKTRAADAFNEAVRASVEKTGVSGAAFLSNVAAATAATISLERILQQKYVALFSQAEVWVDYRRTGYPTLIPAANNYTDNVIPKRLPYPLDEQTYNGGNVPGGMGITTGVWWER